MKHGIENHNYRPKYFRLQKPLKAYYDPLEPRQNPHLTRSLLTRLFSVIKVGATALHSGRSPIAMGRASKVRMLRISDIDFDRSQHEVMPASVRSAIAAA
jgi:hypothetical protein